MRSLPSEIAAGSLANRTLVSLALGLLCSMAAFAQTLDLADGPMKVDVKFHLPAGLGTDQAQTDATSSALSPGLAFYTNYYLALGSTFLPFNIVGADPSLGASTTTIPTVFVPLRFVFTGPGNPTLDGTNAVTATANSPIFATAPYSAGSTDLGVTQYGDALQRAEFWNLPGFSPDYHVLLSQPTVAPTVTISVPAASGTASLLSNGGYVGVVDTAFFESAISALALGFPANQLPIFLTDNVYLGTNGSLQQCCILGYHASQGPPAATARTWIYAAYGEPGTFTSGLFADTVGLSHEVAEWLNDPFVGSSVFGFLNYVPPASVNGGCMINFETGDPLEGGPYTFSKVTNGMTYHVQDEVLLPWYLHTNPSFSANNWYTFQNLSAPVPLVIDAPPSIAGSYANTATVTWAPVDTAAAGPVVAVGRGCPADSIGLGSPEDPYLADPAGKIVLIDRGSCGISLKVDRAARAGAIGVLIGLVAPGAPFPFIFAGGTSFVPTLVITQDLSGTIKNALLSSPVSATISPGNALPAPPSTLCGPG